MKTLIHLFLTFLFLLPIVNAQEQHTFSSKEDIFTNWIKQEGQHTAYNWTAELHRVGELQQTYLYEIRNFDCWR